MSAGQDEPDLRDLMLLGSTAGTGSSSSKSSGSSNSSAVQHVCGLLEVEPLHFVCHATSDGTRMERMDTGTDKPICNVLSPVSYFSVSVAKTRKNFVHGTSQDVSCGL